MLRIKTLLAPTGIYEDCSAAWRPSSAGPVLTELCRHSPLQARRRCKEQRCDSSSFCLLSTDVMFPRPSLQKAFPRYESALAIMTEIGNRLGQTQVYLGVAKCWLLQKELEKVAGTASASARTRVVSLTAVLSSPPLCVFQALESLQRAQELADGIGNKVNDLLETQTYANHMILCA